MFSNHLQKRNSNFTAMCLLLTLRNMKGKIYFCLKRCQRKRRTSIMVLLALMSHIFVITQDKWIRNGFRWINKFPHVIKTTDFNGHAKGEVAIIHRVSLRPVDVLVSYLRYLRYFRFQNIQAFLYQSLHPEYKYWQLLNWILKNSALLMTCSVWDVQQLEVLNISLYILGLKSTEYPKVLTWQCLEFKKVVID